MKFKIITSISIIFAMAMFFGMLMFSVDDGGLAKAKERLELAKTLPLQHDKNPEVNDLIKNFMTAETAADMESLKNCVSDIGDYDEQTLLQKKHIVTGVSDINCYTIDGYLEDSYVVYIAYTYSVNNCKTPIPAVIRRYVCKDENGKYVVYSGKTYQIVLEYIKKTEENEAVKTLVDTTKEQLNELKKNDAEVRDFFSAIEEAKADTNKKLDEAKSDDENKEDAATEEKTEEKTEENKGENKEEDKAQADANQENGGN